MPRSTLWIWWPLVSLPLAVLLARLDPDLARTATVPGAIAVWFAHVFIGLGIAIACTRALGRWSRFARWRPLLQLAIGGVVGSLLFAPVSLGIESVLAVPDTDVPDDWLDAWESRGGLWAVAAEWFWLAPPYLASWAVLNLPPLTAGMQVSAPRRTAGASAAAPVEAAPQPATAAPQATAHDGPAAAAAAPAPSASAQPLIDRIPPAIGRDLVVVQSDLHYLQVRSTQGRATILGTLVELESELGAQGLRVHRSFWVAIAHVRRVQRTANGWHCVLSDKTKVPISRRRIAEVKDRLGVDFVREQPPG